MSAARVIARSTDTGAIRSASTDSNGSFVLLQLPAGDYQIRIEKQGFVALVTSVTVRSGELTETTASLQVGTVNQNVYVAADAMSLMDVASAEVSTSLHAQEIQDIPSLDRDPVT